MQAIVMTATRQKIHIDAQWMQSNASLFGYVEASGGVWVPCCDLKQYESGNRPFAEPH
jgi:hypothetical protein